MGNGPRYSRSLVGPIADDLVRALEGRAILAGSNRRGSVTCGDIDLVLNGIARDEAIAALLAKGLTLDVSEQPRDELSLAVTWSPLRLKVDVWTPKTGSEGACLMHATGPGLYNSVMRRWARMQDMRLSHDGVWRGDERIAGATEQECCEALGWPNPPPEHRERFMEWIDPYLEILNESA